MPSPSPTADLPIPRPALTERLRDETRDQHEELELRLDWRRRMATQLGYRTLLTRWWGFHRSFEPAVEAMLGAEIMRPRRKLHLLERDLGHFGMNPETIAALPRFPLGAGLRGRHALLGALYVTEGSTLGGQVIAHHIRRSLGDAVASGGCAYYESYGKRETAPMWAAFRAVLDRSAEDGDPDDVIAGARWTFDALRVWLTDDSQPPPGPEDAAAPR